jgi:hypothetical protein
MIKRYYKSLILFTLLSFSNFVQSQTTNFQRIIGGTGDDRSYSMLQTKDGGYILTGYSASYGSGGNDIYLTKTDGLGKVIWTKTYGTSGNETGWKVKQTSDSGYIVVGTASSKKGDGVFFKTDVNGVLKWGKIFNSDSAEEVYNVIESRSKGDFYITGFVKTDSFGTDAFISKYSAKGDYIWHNKFGGKGDEEGYSLVEELNGNIAVVGVVVDDSITIGGTNGSPGDEDMFIGRFDSDGNKKWIKNYGTMENDQAWDIKFNKGEYITTGWTEFGSSNGDLMVTTIDTSGNFISGFYLNGGGSSKAFSIITNPDDTYSLTGYVSTVAKGRESLYINVSKYGTVNISNIFGGNSTDGHWPSEITRTIDGGFTIFTSSNSFKTKNGYDLYMIRTDNKGVSNCNFSTTVFTNFMLSMQSKNFGKIRSGIYFDNLSLTTKTISNTFDSVLCCKLQAQVAASVIRICTGESIRIGKPEIPGYVYKWTSVGGSFSSSETSPLVKPTSNTTYKLVVSSTDGKCSKDSANISVNIRPILTNTNFVRDTFFCIGDTVQVKAKSGAIDYKWVGKKTTLTGQTVKLYQEDQIILTIKDTTTCEYKDTFKVLRKQLPVFDLGKDTTICDNTSVTLLGPANMKSYLWNGGQGKNRSFAASEERTHTLAVVDSFGCKFSDGKVIFNNPSSTFSLGPDTAICKGINYTIVGPGFLTNYFWNGISSFQANKVTSIPGTYILQAQNSFGCIHRDTIVLKQKPDPTFSLGPDGGVCASGGRKLKGPSGAVSYNWKDGSSSQDLDVFFPGIYWLQVSGTNGCIYRDSISLVTVSNPKPEIGNDTTICDFDSIYLDAGNYVTYRWNTNETTRIIKVKKANLYDVTVTDANTCTGNDDRSIKTKFCLIDVNEKIAVAGLKVQPNPAKNTLNIEWLANEKEASFAIYSISGKKVFEQKALPGLANYSLDVSQWSRGVYYLKVTTSSASQSVKVVLD